MAIGIGVEISPSAVRAVILERLGALQREGRTGAPPVKLLAMRESPCETSRPEALTSTLTQLRLSLRITQPIILGIPSTSSILATVRPLIPNTRRAALAVQFELQQLLPWPVQIPIYPGNLVVLAISVVVPLLGTTDLITGLQHRHSL